MAKKSVKIEKEMVKVRFIMKGGAKFGKEIDYPKAIAEKLVKCGKVELVK